MKLNVVFSFLQALLKPYLPCASSTIAKTTSSGALGTMKTLDESDVGIFCFISKLPGFRGILKQRYSDFIVNEVDTDGNVVHLISLDVPPEMVVKQEDEAKKPADDIKSYTSEIESFRCLAGDSNAERLETLIEHITSGGGNDASPVVLDPSSDKCHRTAVHNFFKENFKFLITDTIEGPDSSSRCIRVRLNLGGNRNRGKNSKKRKERGEKPFDSRGSESWPEQVGKFLRFHLYKENKDTQEALGLIAKMLGIQPKSFGFSGTKDKRSVSTQRVTVFKQCASKLAALNERLIGIKVGDFCHVKEGLALGQLFGNRFTITLRGIVADCEGTIKACTDSLGRHGFINYFGLQRFGSGSVPTHHVGAALLRGEWKAAVSMILDPREAQKNIIAKAREYYKRTGDIDGTLKQLPRHLIAERAILLCLKKCPGNYLQALKAIPRTLRMMYVHSYQSFLWNHAASMRVEKHGTSEVVLGDLVYLKGDDDKNGVSSLTSQCEDDNGKDYEVNNRSQLDDNTVIDFPEERNAPVKAVTAEDIQAGTYTIEDIVLPMPGSRVMFPSNDVAEVYHELSNKDGINLTESVHGVKEFSITCMTGGYRRVFQKPIDFEWELLTYTDPNLPLAETDLDRITKAKSIHTLEKNEPVNGVRDEATDYSVGKDESANRDGDKYTYSDAQQSDCLKTDIKAESICNSTLESRVALKMAFTLPASCYATMAIRELIKTSTSVAFHKTLNQ